MTGAHPQLARLERAATSGRAAALLAHAGLTALRHRPIVQLSTGEARCIMLHYIASYYIMPYHITTGRSSSCRRARRASCCS